MKNDSYQKKFDDLIHTLNYIIDIFNHMIYIFDDCVANSSIKIKIWIQIILFVRSVLPDLNRTYSDENVRIQIQFGRSNSMTPGVNPIKLIRGLIA